MTDTYIRSSKHKTQYANTGKRELLILFVAEYRMVAQAIIDHIWENGYSWTDKNKNIHHFSIKNNELYFPSYIDYNAIPIPETFLTARALSSLCTQVAGMISAECEKQRKRLYQLNRYKEEHIPKKKYTSLINSIKRNIPQPPDCSKIRMELSSKCIDFESSDNEFVGFIRIKSFSKTHGSIKLPIKSHKHYEKLAMNGQQMTSYLISETSIDVRWKITKQEEKKTGESIGIDQGLKDVITCSNGFTPSNACSHNHTLDSILQKMTRKKKGSKAFKRAQDHRTNFINYSINQLNLQGVKEIKLEEIINIGYKKTTNGKLRHWTNTQIRDKIESYCEENGVRFTLISSTYRSQRCNNCGIVRKANRKGKIYTCKHCGHTMDADLNASLNINVDLPEVPYALRKLQMNRGNGFYWNEYGFYEFETGRSLESLLLQNEDE